MMTDELKPCPFCGGEAECIEDGSHSTAWEIGCYNGQCAAEPSVWEPRKEVAIAAWNTRADLATPTRCAECDCEKGGADCNWIATPAPAVKVKALVWDGFRAGPYWIEVESGGLAHLFRDYDRNDERVEPIKGGFLTLVSIDDLKAAAQAHHDATILAALDPATPLDDPRVEALVEAGKALVDRWDSPLWKELPHTGESIADLRAALSALEENK